MRSPCQQACALDRLPDINLSEGAAGRGTIRFGQQASMWGRNGGFSMWTPSLDPTPQLIAIDNARSVFDQIQRAARDLTAARVHATPA